MARIKYGQIHRDVIKKVQELVTKLNILNPFTGGKPTKKWYRLFMRWHPILKEQMTQALSHEWAVFFNNIICWFWDWQEYMQRNGYEHIFDDPSHIYNWDETGFLMAPKPGKVIAGKGEAHVYQAGTSSLKNQITALLMSSAAGHFILPMIVYPGVQPRMQLCNEFHVTSPWGIFGLSIQLGGLRLVHAMAWKWFHEGHQGEGCDSTSITTYQWGKEPLVYPCIWALQQEWHHSICPVSQSYPSGTDNGSHTDEFYQDSI